MTTKFVRCTCCGKAVPANSNYCYLCGEALSDLAIQNESIKYENAQLLILRTLLPKMRDDFDKNQIKNLLLQYKKD